VELERHIRGCVLDQDHLADLLIGYESQAAAIQARVASLINAGLVELYTYLPSGEARVLPRNDAVAIVECPSSWAWQSPADEAQLYFLNPVRLPDGSLAYRVQHGG
jgi:hypothetical protein